MKDFTFVMLIFFHESYISLELTKKMFNGSPFLLKEKENKNKVTQTIN